VEVGSRRRCPPVREVEEMLSGATKPKDADGLVPDIDSLTALQLLLIELVISDKELERLTCELQDPTFVVIVAVFLH